MSTLRNRYKLKDGRVAVIEREVFRHIDGRTGREDLVVTIGIRISGLEDDESDALLTFLRNPSGDLPGFMHGAFEVQEPDFHARAGV